MGWGNAIVIAPDIHRALKLEKAIVDSNPAATVARCSRIVGGHVPLVIGLDCADFSLLNGEQYPACAICKTDPCAGCGHEFVVDMTTAKPSTCCVECGGWTSLWSFLARLTTSGEIRLPKGSD